VSPFLLALARLLPLADREVVLGDLCECEATRTEIFFNLIELYLLRALQPYADWRVWVCLGLIPFLTLLHIGIGVAVVTLIWHSHMSDGGITLPILAEVLRLSLLLFTASMTSSMAAVSMARRTPLPLFLAALFPAMICFHHYPAAGAPSFCIFLFLLPAACGVWLALRRLHPWFLWCMTAALLLALLTDPLLASHSWSLRNAFLLVLPALYCSFTLTFRGHNATA